MAALFFDIDGTILDGKTHTIPESTLRSLKRARESGHILFINTGRTACDIPKKLEEVPFDGYCCGCGSYIRYKEQLLFHSSISCERGMEIVNYMNKLGLPGVFEGTEALYFQKENYGNREWEEFREHAISKGNGTTYTIDESELRYDKLMFCTEDREAVERFSTFLDPDIRVIDCGTGVYECIQSEYSKATAIKWLQKYLQLDEKELYVFGDSVNDIDMFVYVKHAIAMGKHDNILDQETEYVTDTVERDGIQKALEHYGLIHF